MLEYKVIPFVAQITEKESSDQVAKQLQDIINQASKSGWKFEDVQSIKTEIKALGCFAGAGKSGKDDSVAFAQLVIFSRPAE